MGGLALWSRVCVVLVVIVEDPAPPTLQDSVLKEISGVTVDGLE